MTRVQLTLKRVRARPVVVPLKRPVVSKVGLFQDWPLILIDLYTKEGVVGHSYLEPYIKQSARYIVPAIEDLAEAAKGQPVAPFDGYRRGVGSLHLVGREGVSLIAVIKQCSLARATMSCPTSCALAVSAGGCVRQRSRAPRALQCPHTSTQRWLRISCASPIRRTGLSGKIGPTRFCPSPSN
jgi:mandelate racemase